MQFLILNYRNYPRFIFLVFVLSLINCSRGISADHSDPNDALAAPGANNQRSFRTDLESLMPGTGSIGFSQEASAQIRTRIRAARAGGSFVFEGINFTVTQRNEDTLQVLFNGRSYTFSPYEQDGQITYNLMAD